ncbi:MlaD family protein [Carbonactinospora thermoautotrophica]|uniref:MlaD family protein n=1 Tax=Carbonactinospora thermoautotrophica TaxID=1469144 RepID=UPI0027E1F9FA|nr:MlaD family protein [Carbonactinospora thermoautotrophica]
MIIRTAVKLQLLAFAALTALGIAYVGVNYIGVGDRLFGRTYTISADFAEAGGIFSSAEVTYRGVPVGRVGELHLRPDGVRVDLELEKGTKIPADTIAVVANRSAVGEQYVDLQPRRDGGPYLQPGAVIPRGDTRTPISTTTLLVNLDRLVNSVDRQDLTTVIGELGRAFSGTGRDLQRLIDSGDELTVAAEQNLPQTIKLIQDSQKVLKTQNDQASAIKSFSRDLALLTDQVRASDPDLRKVLDNGPVAFREFEALLRTTRPALPVLLGNLVSVGQVTTARLPAIEQILVTYPQNLVGTFTIVPGDGTVHFGLALPPDPPVCRKGYQSTERRTPDEGWGDDPSKAKRANTKVKCAEPRGSRTNVRGAHNVPRAKTRGSNPNVGSNPTQSSQARPSAGTPRATGAPTFVISGYDPVTGLAMGPDGEPIIIGSLGGQQKVMGKDSWTWLLIGPLGN